jgi:hypothetical protein
MVMEFMHSALMVNAMLSASKIGSKMVVLSDNSNYQPGVLRRSIQHALHTIEGNFFSSFQHQ